MVHFPRDGLANTEERQCYPQEDELHTKRQVTYNNIIVVLTFTSNCKAFRAEVSFALRIWIPGRSIDLEPPRL